MVGSPLDFRKFETKADEVAGLLGTIGNVRRLMVLCCLLEHGEMAVTDLAAKVALSPSALSQHLGKMQAAGLVSFRRESQTLWYRIAAPRTKRLLATLDQLYVQGDTP